MARRMSTEEARATAACRKTKPTGRPRNACRQAWAELTPQAKQTLLDLLGSENPIAACQAAKFIIERAEGKAVQPVAPVGPGVVIYVPEPEESSA